MATIPHTAAARKRARPKRRPRVLVLHGPSPFADGTGSGPDIIATVDARLTSRAEADSVDLVAFQSNSEAELAERINAAATEGVGFMVIDPAGLTHTGAALRAALSSAAIPFIEVHLANGHARLPFRQDGATSDKAVGTIVGLGVQGYELALTYALRHVKD